MKLVSAILMLLALTACDQASQRVDTMAREGAKGVVSQTIATRFPQVPKQLITPFTDCIIDNSDAAEIRIFAKSAVIGVDDTTVATVRTVLSRPETVRCLSQSTAGMAGTLG
ncbi:hypothetical protein [Sulfitobacter sp.]|jgi:predicted ABC-type ATPase|uniref:hypothetical protein n=1 Tax=Sulfitobacter sp. TaxID=1903071 RepID=UPI003563DF17|tara:strand:- start:102 stop:437 length:336 start_codon:yes stop_codon:yes gene_type:complete